MKPSQKIKDLPKEFRSYISIKPSMLSCKKRKFIYKIVQVWRFTSDNFLANEYIKEMQLLKCLTWNDYKSYNQPTIKEIEDKYNLLKL